MLKSASMAAARFIPRLHHSIGSTLSTSRTTYLISHNVPNTTPYFLKRYASTASTASESIPTIAKKKKRSPLRKFLFRSSLTIVVVGGYLYFTDTRASAHKYVVVPLVRWLYPDAEDAHHAGVAALHQLYKYGLHPRERSSPDLDGKLATEVNFVKQKISESDTLSS